MLITSYIDESGTHNSGKTIVSAFAGNVEQWAEFTRQIDPFFAEYGVKVFHAKELRDNDGDFRGWPVRKRARFIDEFTAIMHSTLELGINVVLNDKDYERVYASELGKKKSSAATRYGICFRALLSTLIQAARTWGTPAWPLQEKRQIDFVAEHGHANSRSTLALYERIKDHVDDDIKQLLGVLSFHKKEECRPLATADAIAHFAWREEMGFVPKRIYCDWNLRGARVYDERRNLYRVEVTPESLELLKQSLLLYGF